MEKHPRRGLRNFLRGALEQFCFRLLFGLIYLLYRSYRIIPHNEHHRTLAQELHSQRAYFLACWHEHFLAVTLAQIGHPFRPLASRSFAGRLMGYSLDRLGFPPIYGSQNRKGADKGGQEARQLMLDLCAKGFPSAYTVDGSTGPRRKVKPGVVDLARKSGAAILTSASASQSYWELNTWDRLKIPKPFTKIVVSYGLPIAVPSDISSEAFETVLQRVADSINQAEREAKQQLAALRGLVEQGDRIEKRTTL